MGLLLSSCCYYSCHSCYCCQYIVTLFQVFDAFVVVMSFLMDFSFLVFLHDIDTKDFVFILAILLPWRVIRVVNSKYKHSIKLSYLKTIVQVLVLLLCVADSHVSSELFNERLPSAVWWL